MSVWKSLFHLMTIMLLFLFLGVPTRAQWQENGVAVCSLTSYQDNPQIISDGARGGIITWRDQRGGNSHIYAQRIDANGMIQWTADGTAIYTGVGEHRNPQIIPDGAGGAFITWTANHQTGDDVYAQRVDASGNVLWPSVVIICNLLGDQRSPCLTSDGAGGTIMMWRDQRSFGNYDIYAQRIDANGNSQWVDDGVGVCTVGPDKIGLSIISDDFGGAIITYAHSPGASWDIYAQRINASGVVQWAGADGVVISAANGDQEYPSLTSDGAGGAIIAWKDRRTGSYDIYAQRINANGAVQWEEDGVAICTAPSFQNVTLIISDDAGGAIIVWRDRRSWERYDIYAQRINASGTAQWTQDGVAICTVPWDNNNLGIISDGAGGAIITWSDYRTGNGDIYAQRIDSDGIVQWIANGVAISTAPDVQWPWDITSDGAKGAIITWMDSRNANWDIYVNSINYAGIPKVPTLIESYTTTLINSGVLIHWELSETEKGTEFFIQKAEARDMPFRELINPDIICNGLSYSSVDENIKPGTAYRYRVGVLDETSRRILFETDEIYIPEQELILHQNYPNPFNPITSVTFSLPGEFHVILEIFDITGRHVCTLVKRKMPVGMHSVKWNGCDSTGRQVASGMYFYRLTAGKETISRRMVLLR